ncbi:hypothetical protein BGZ83_007074 [Gryganskiella cystojenkinii]|nr:hypothetical protein BGZ83_007074 [Gryganskiella cystojenkinii]
MRPSPEEGLYDTPTGSSDHITRSTVEIRDTCESCGGTRFEEQDVAVVCTGCGTVLREGVLESNFENFGDKAGFTRVNKIGRGPTSAIAERVISHTQYARILSKDQTDQRSQFQRDMFMHERLEKVAVLLGANSKTDVFRAIYLWQQLQSHETDIRYHKTSFCQALACLYIAFRESKRGISIFQVALAAEQRPPKVALAYAKIKIELSQKEKIDLTNPYFDVEQDPCMLLDKIMMIGSSDSMQRGDLDHLPDFLKTTFGIGSEDRVTRLRKIWASSQKCLRISMDSGLTSGRHLQGAVAACMIVAIEVELHLEECPESLLSFASQCFGAAESTVQCRYKELRKCMHQWAQRLPYVPTKISSKKLVYYLEDVLKHFGHLQEVNTRLWKLLDDPNQVDSDDEGDLEQEGTSSGASSDEVAEISRSSDADKNDTAKDPNIDTLVKIPSRPIAETPEENAALTVDNLEELCVESVVNTPKEVRDRPSTGDDPDATLYDIIGTVSAHNRYQPIHPPAYTANQKRRKDQAMRILIAKHHLDPKGLLRDTIVEAKRTKWVTRLVELGLRSNEALLSASDRELSVWYNQDELEAMRMKQQTRRDLDSLELSDQDLSEQEFQQYYRSDSESQAMWRVKGPDIIAYEKQVLNRETRKRTPTRLNTAKRKALETQPGYKRPRSSKLRLEALSDSEPEDDQHQQQQPTPRLEPTPSRATEEEEEIVGVVGEDAVYVQQRQMQTYEQDDSHNNGYHEEEEENYNEIDS